MGVLGSAEMCRLLGVNRQRLSVLAQRSSFPEPTARLSMGAIWRLDDVQAFAVASGRRLHAEELDALNVAAGNDSPATPSELMGTAEIAIGLGVSRQRVVQLAQTASFPRPVARLAMGAVWNVDDISDFARASGRDFRPELAVSHQAV